MVRLRIVVLAVLLGCASSALGLDDELLPGTTLALHQGKKGKAERLVIVARAGLPAPLPGGTDDPRIVGARVEIGNPATREWARLEAPASGWSLNELGTLFRFRNASPKEHRDQPLRVVIRHGKGLKVVGRAIGMTLDEPTQRSLAVVLTTGSRRYCLLFGGKLRRDEPGRFVAHSAPVPSGCLTSELPAGTTSTTIAATTTTSVPRLPGGPTTSTSAPPPPTSSTTSTTPKQLPQTTSTTAPPADPCANLHVPGGHRPPPGQCRIWYPGRSPAQQPPVGDCDELEGNVPDGACLVRG